MPPDVDSLAAALAERLAPLVARQLRADEERLIDLDGLAERLGVSRRGASGLVSRGELPEGFLIGGCRRWRWEDVVKHLQGRQGRRPRRGRGRYARHREDGAA